MKNNLATSGCVDPKTATNNESHLDFLLSELEHQIQRNKNLIEGVSLSANKLHQLEKAPAQKIDEEKNSSGSLGRLSTNTNILRELNYILENIVSHLQICI